MLLSSVSVPPAEYVSVCVCVCRPSSTARENHRFCFVMQMRGASAANNRISKTNKKPRARASLKVSSRRPECECERRRAGYTHVDRRLLDGRIYRTIMLVVIITNQ